MAEATTIDQGMIAAWEAGGAVRDYPDRHLRVMVGWLRGIRDDRPLREYERVMLSAYVAELDRRGLRTEAA